jgi:hypothetical protein
MKTSLIATILLLASGASFAGEAADEAANRTAFVGERTRAEVKADTQAARQAGQLGINEYAAQQQPASAGTRSRADIRAESVQAARANKIHELF